MINQRFEKLLKFNWKYLDNPAFHKPNAETDLFIEQIEFNKQKTHIFWYNLLSGKETKTNFRALRIKGSYRYKCKSYRE